MSGHEHAPSLAIDGIERGTDLMMLAAGAAVPPKATPGYTYQYNLVEFDWDLEQDALSVVIRPRVWIDRKKRFGSDDTFLTEHGDRFVLGCPYFKRAPREDVLLGDDAGINQAVETILIGDPRQNRDSGGEEVSEEYASVLLIFFRDITGRATSGCAYVFGRTSRESERFTE